MTAKTLGIWAIARELVKGGKATGFVRFFDGLVEFHGGGFVEFAVVAKD